MIAKSESTKISMNSDIENRERRATDKVNEFICSVSPEGDTEIKRSLRDKWFDCLLEEWRKAFLMIAKSESTKRYENRAVEMERRATEKVNEFINSVPISSSSRNILHSNEKALRRDRWTRTMAGARTTKLEKYGPKGWEVVIEQGKISYENIFTKTKTDEDPKNDALPKGWNKVAESRGLEVAPYYYNSYYNSNGVKVAEKTYINPTQAFFSYAKENKMWVRCYLSTLKHDVRQRTPENIHKIVSIAEIDEMDPSPDVLGFAHRSINWAPNSPIPRNIDLTWTEYKKNMKNLSCWDHWLAMKDLKTNVEIILEIDRMKPSPDSLDYALKEIGWQQDYIKAGITWTELKKDTGLFRLQFNSVTLQDLKTNLNKKINVGLTKKQKRDILDKCIMDKILLEWLQRLQHSPEAYELPRPSWSNEAGSKLKLVIAGERKHFAEINKFVYQCCESNFKKAVRDPNFKSAENIGEIKIDIKDSLEANNPDDGQHIQGNSNVDTELSKLEKPSKKKSTIKKGKKIQAIGRAFKPQ
jgi:hypothetical protein